MDVAGAAGHTVFRVKTRLRFAPLVLVVALAAAPAVAHRAGPVHTSRHVAHSVFGDGLCDVGTMRVPVVRRDLAREGAGLATWFFETDPLVGPFTDCEVAIDSRPLSFVRLCTVLGHEFGHLDGRPHSENPRSIMWPYTLRLWPPCVRAAGPSRDGRGYG